MTRPSYQCLFFTRDYAVMLARELKKKQKEMAMILEGIEDELAVKRRKIAALETLLDDR